MIASRLAAIGVCSAVLASIACGAASRTTVLSVHDPAEYPCVLAPPSTLAPDFFVRQTLTITAKRDGKPQTGELDAVVQKQGDELVIIGFGPMNVKAFSLTHRGDVIEVEQRMGPALPFSPRNVVVDVHRVYFKRLPPPDIADGVRRGELDGEIVEENWRGGELVAISFSRPGQFRGAVSIELGPGCARAACEPQTATLRNEWFDYTLVIHSEEYERLGGEEDAEGTRAPEGLGTNR